MTELQIKTHLHQGQGSIEMRPPLDEQSVDIIHHLGLTGISYIAERAEANDECVAFGFDHIDQTRLDKAARTIAQALEETGTVVSFGDSLETTIPQPRPRRGLRLPKLRLL